MSYLAYVRHGLSQANVDKVVAGHMDTPLVDMGRQQARDTAGLIKDINFHHAYTSTLQRAKEALEIILGELKQDISHSTHEELKERSWGDVEGTDYGFYGNSQYSKEEAETWLTWTGKPRGGESYEDISNRIVPFFEKNILPRLRSGENILIVSHNGISKPLQRHLEDIPREKIHTLNLRNCEVKLYEFDETGKVKRVESRLLNAD
jgi:2,3-bisphosphoglycerate-dependent phosphoglycerate mutase